MINYVFISFSTVPIHDISYIHLEKLMFNILMNWSNESMVLFFLSRTDVCQKDWFYFRGYCYRKVAPCRSWSLSQGTCSIQGANLPSIHSQEENVFVQSLHGGEKSWLGLSDINTEGKFVWTDGTSTDFHHWAKFQPNNFGNQDCVHTLGFLKDHDYEWNDVNCTDCHRFTCKKGKFKTPSVFS